MTKEKQDSRNKKKRNMTKRREENNTWGPLSWKFLRIQSMYSDHVQIQRQRPQYIAWNCNIRFFQIQHPVNYETARP